MMDGNVGWFIKFHWEHNTMLIQIKFVLLICLFCMQYIKSLLVFGILAGVSVCQFPNWSCVHTLYWGHHCSTFNFRQHTKAKPGTWIY